MAKDEERELFRKALLKAQEDFAASLKSAHEKIDKLTLRLEKGSNDETEDEDDLI